MNYNKKSIEDIEVAGKRVLCRCDFNVPTKEGKITSDKRIVAAMPTIRYLVDQIRLLNVLLPQYTLVPVLETEHTTV